MAAVVVFAVINVLAFSSLGMWLHFVVPAGTLIVNYAAITSFRMIFEEREKRKIRKTFSSYVSPGVIALVEKDPQKYFYPGGETKELTVMFSDIRSFTTLSEGMTADELVKLLNEYLGEMTDVLFKRWGTLDKYIGDAIMAFWGSPYPQQDHAARACGCGLDMIKRLEELNMKWEMEGRKQLSIGVGFNSGPVNVGNMGSSKRLAWTVMGDNVNLASRLEGLTKEYGAKIITGEGTYREAKGQYVFRDLDKIRVKGKLQPVDIYELLGFGNEAAKYQDLLVRWSDANASYRRQEWDVAVQKFESLLAKYPDDGPSLVFLKRAQEFYREAPAAGWDGVYTFKTK
jgi:adenylate cyclase